MPATLTMNAVKIGWSDAETPRAAASELAQQLSQPNPELVLYFSTARHDPHALAEAMESRFPGVSVGCTTAGEIGPSGYTRESIVAMSLGRGPIRVQQFPIASVSSLDLEVVAAHRRLFDQRRAYPVANLADDCLGMLLVDGLSLSEEHLVAALYSHFQPMSIVGGSAGDDYAYRQTQVFAQGHPIANGAVFLVFEMGGVPFQTFRLQDFAPMSDYLVVTSAEGDKRLIHEIDGEPANEVYARHVGVPVGQMTPDHFASHSLLVQVGGEEYIRSVRQVTPEGSLCLHSAIDEGVVVRLGRSDDTLVSLARFLEGGSSRVAQTLLTICFDCMHRRMELTRQGHLKRAGEILGQVPTIGFSTYGEVVDSIHVNQTMTGVIFGWRDGAREPR